MKNTIIVEYDDLGFDLKKIIISGVTYIVSGECSQCGKCCKHPDLHVFKKIDGKCPHLAEETVDGKYVGRCRIYSNRPVGCVFFPRDMSDFKLLSSIPECTYKIIKDFKI